MGSAKKSTRYIELNQQKGCQRKPNCHRGQDGGTNNETGSQEKENKSDSPVPVKKEGGCRVYERGTLKKTPNKGGNPEALGIEKKFLNQTRPVSSCTIN